MVQASIFGKNDGPGASLVYYLGLPEGWTPDQEPNKVPNVLQPHLASG